MIPFKNYSDLRQSVARITIEVQNFLQDFYGYAFISREVLSEEIIALNSLKTFPHAKRLTAYLLAVYLASIKSLWFFFASIKDGHKNSKTYSKNVSDGVIS